MRNFIFLWFFALAWNGQSQYSGQAVLEWRAKSVYPLGEYSVQIPQFNPGNMRYYSYARSLEFAERIKTGGPVQPEVQWSNVRFEPIAASELGDLDVSKIPATFNISAHSARARDEYYTTLTATPIIKEGSTFKKLISFDYALSASSARLQTMSAMAISNSVLATGEWHRFYVEKSGVYKLTRGFLQSLGVNVNVDPRRLKIYGHGGRMLSLRNEFSYPIDPTENPIRFIGEEDGVFDAEDYILFYAEGMDQWNAESQTHRNLYADRSYYYVTSTGENGLRIPEAAPAPNPTVTATTFEDYQFHERDLVNIGKLGRRWFGERFNIQNEQEFSFTFPEAITSEPISVSIYAAAAAFNATNFAVSANGQNIGSISFAPLSTTSTVYANPGVLNTTVPGTSNVTLKLTYNNNGVPGSSGYLDYIIAKAKRPLKGYGNQYAFWADYSTNIGSVEFNFTSAQNIVEVWDITDLYNVRRFTNSDGSAFSFSAPMGDRRRYAVLDANDFYQPLRESSARVPNQNLKGTVFTNAQGQFQEIDYLIVTPAFLVTQAEQLASFHRTYSNLNTKVVTLEAIYPEFSSGKQDLAAIRNFVRYVYENGSTTQTRLRYLNLFGDASFDFKSRTQGNTNIVPIYHALNGYSSGEAAFTTDDFFGMLDPQEGLIDSPGGGLLNVGGVDVAVGRMLVHAPAQAAAMVNKIVEYHDLQAYGSWRNNVVFISDDADTTGDISLQARQNQLSETLKSFRPFLNIDKIFADAYQQESAAGGQRYSRARQDLYDAFEKGALVFNYLGHGGEEGLASERLWTKQDGQNLSNRYKYPLFITITCEFSRFDNPTREAAGEFMYWNTAGGALSMVTTVRSIGQFEAENFNDRYMRYLFAYNSGVAVNDYYTIADALRRAKNESPSFATNVVTFLGDPALKLAIPQPKVRLTKINDVPVGGPTDALQALGFVKLAGEVTDEFDNVLTNYNGELSVNIFDKPQQRTTLNNDNQGSEMTFSENGETIFRGNASVNSGLFEFGFVVPRDIRVPLGNGRISFYAKRNQLHLDKTGADESIQIGGINENAAEDNIGPTVRLYMNDESFVSGGITNESPFFLAFLEDENGINTASGIGHDIIAILDGDESNPFVLNDYYETELDNYKKGQLRFPMRNLSPGLHTITFQAWDVYNNPIRAEIQFVVVGDEGLTLSNVLNYPNPFSTYTQFWFSHNKPYEPLEVQVQVMTVTGKVVYSHHRVVNTEGFLSREISWDGRDDFGERIGKGVYVYRLRVKAQLSGKSAEKIEKLVIL